MHDDGNCIQVRVLHNDKIYLRKPVKKSLFGFCSADTI